MNIIEGTRVEDRRADLGLIVKHEEECCPAPGPPFSKIRGVAAHIEKRPERLIGVLDTYHSQAGHAVAYVCGALGKRCVNFYPVYKHEPGYREPQRRAAELGAQLVGLPAGRSAILYHQARKRMAELGGYMMPNALKLPESVTETALEVERSRDELPIDLPWLISVSSGTLAAGVIRGVHYEFRDPPFLIHMGYDRSEDALRQYIINASGVRDAKLFLINEGYHYRDAAEVPPGIDLKADRYYDAKALKWWIEKGRSEWGEAIFWLIG